MFNTERKFCEAGVPGRPSDARECATGEQTSGSGVILGFGAVWGIGFFFFIGALLRVLIRAPLRVL